MTQQQFTERYTFSIKTDKIGGGSFGTVYKAYDNVLDREVAIKVSEVKYVGAKEFSLLEEFKAIENIAANPFIANYEDVYRFESFQGIFDYGIMQYYAMGNLSSYLKNNTVTKESRESIVLNILEGIGFLHQNKVVHRDLKPSNILVVNRRGKIIPKITDFGLSKQASTDAKGSRFTNSFAGGTFQYSSPEQIKGLPLKLNTDLWSFGTLAYEILTGKTLFEADTMSTASAQWQNEITNKILHQDIEGVINISDISSNWKLAITSCLKRNIKDRVENSDQILKLLECDIDLVENSVSIEKTKKEIEPKKQPTKQILEDNDDTVIKKVKIESGQKVNQNKSGRNNDHETRIHSLVPKVEDNVEPKKTPKPTKNLNKALLFTPKINKNLIKVGSSLVILVTIALVIYILKPTEQELWDNAISKDRIEDYREYLSSYPEGKWSGEATVKLYDFAEKEGEIKLFEELLSVHPNTAGQAKLDNLIYQRDKKLFDKLIKSGQSSLDGAIIKMSLGQVKLAAELYKSSIKKFQEAEDKHNADDESARGYKDKVIDRVKLDITKQENDMSLNPSQRNLYLENIFFLKNALK